MPEPTASTWVPCDPHGFAVCPHCASKAWFRESKWAGCEHAIGPGHMGKSVDTPPAMIFNIDALEARRHLAELATKRG
jgi:hypothetical protein